MESVFRGTSPDGRWLVTVDCTLSEDGEPTDWVAVVTLDGTHVVDALRTQDSNKMLRWTQRQMQEVMRRTTVEVPDGASKVEAKDA